MRVRHILLAVGAPLILIVGIGVAWGVRQGSQMVAMVDAWSDSLQHSAHPVTMRVAGFPVISTLYVDGHRVGRLSQVTVMRDVPGAVDSLRMVVDVSHEADMVRYDDCRLALNPDVFDSVEGPEVLQVLKHVVTCAGSTQDLRPFGTVIWSGVDREAPLFIERRHHPCDSFDSAGECKQMKQTIEDELHQLRGLRDEIRREIRENVRSNIRVKVP